MGRYARNSIGQYAPVGAAADDLPGGATPTGKKTIDTTAEVDVASYATAQVVDENLTAENIKKDVEVLGVLGEFEGGGASPIQMAKVTINFGSIPNIKAIEFNALMPYPPDNPDSSNVYEYSGTFCVGNSNDTSTAPELDSPITVYLPLYNGIGYITGVFTAHRDYADGGDTYSESVSLSGAAETDPNPDYGIKVTGDCVITITWGS